MNDFTKEELEIINQAMRGYVCDFECYKLYCSAKDKIQSMIDDLKAPEPKSICECNDKYHPNGAICLRVRYE